MTLLVLGLCLQSAPGLQSVLHHSRVQLWRHVLRPLWPHLITYQLAIVVYWLNIALLGAILDAGLRYARRARLLKDHVTAATVAAMQRRILVYQALYAVGALLSFASTYASIGFIIAVQLNAAITPRF